MKYANKIIYTYNWIPWPTEEENRAEEIFKVITAENFIKRICRFKKFLESGVMEIQTEVCCIKTAENQSKIQNLKTDYRKKKDTLSLKEPE